MKHLNISSLWQGRMSRNDFRKRLFICFSLAPLLYAISQYSPYPYRHSSLITFLVLFTALIISLYIAFITTKRFHDLNMSGIVTSIIPTPYIFLLTIFAIARISDLFALDGELAFGIAFLGIIFFLPFLLVYLLAYCFLNIRAVVEKGTNGTNKYGPDPTGNGNLDVLI